MIFPFGNEKHVSADSYHITSLEIIIFNLFPFSIRGDNSLRSLTVATWTGRQLCVHDLSRGRANDRLMMFRIEQVVMTLVVNRSCFMQTAFVSDRLSGTK
jgi:hypothetical protein